MKANEFVKKFGWEQSIEAVKMMPKSWDYCCLRIPDFEFQKNVSCIADCVDMDDLKRLVESHELINSMGGLVFAKKFIETTGSTMERTLENAIADVEACKEVS
jgi:hypothetical protein